MWEITQSVETETLAVPMGLQFDAQVGLVAREGSRDRFGGLFGGSRTSTRLTHSGLDGSMNC